MVCVSLYHCVYVCQQDSWKYWLFDLWAWNLKLKDFFQSEGQTNVLTEIEQQLGVVILNYWKTILTILVKFAEYAQLLCPSSWYIHFPQKFAERGNTLHKFLRRHCNNSEIVETIELNISNLYKFNFFLLIFHMA